MWGRCYINKHASMCFVVLFMGRDMHRCILIMSEESQTTPFDLPSHRVVNSATQVFPSDLADPECSFCT